MKALVVPTIRESCIKEFLEAWKDGDWDRVFVVEDNPHRTFELHGNVTHLSWEDINRDLGEDAWIISHRDSAIRSYGFYKAYKAGATLIVTLDDDCFPGDRHDLCAAHLEAMGSHARWIPSVTDIRPRGLPYYNLGKLDDVVCNMGLWSNVPDLDAVQTMASERVYYVPPRDLRIVPHGQYFPLCGMNMAFRREVTPLTYFPLMGEGSPYRRFDDIWFGIIFKKVLDHLRLYVSLGAPHIEHRRASDPLVNLVKEAPGIVRNEGFWEVIDRIGLKGNEPIACMREVGVALTEQTDTYLVKLGKAIVIWARLFEERK